MILFADTSALLKRYIAEDGTDAVNAALLAADRLVISALTVVEATSGLVRRLAAGDLSEAEYHGMRADLLEDLTDADAIPVDLETLASAQRLVERHRLRTLDSLQLAAALACAPDLFLCADQRLLAAAKSLGLRVRDPLAGPADG